MAFSTTATGSAGSKGAAAAAPAATGATGKGRGFTTPKILSTVSSTKELYLFLGVGVCV